MPFDAIPTDADPYARLKELRDVLRSTQFPVGFVWGFERCSTCAMGLLWEMHHAGTPQYKPGLHYLHEEEIVLFSKEYLNIPEWVHMCIFYGNRGAARVTPKMVADRIDEALDRALIIERVSIG